MSKWDKLRERILAGRADANISFADLDQFLQREGWTRRITGSHHVYEKAGWDSLNLQPRGAHVKRYQVKQIREAFFEKGYSA